MIKKLVSLSLAFGFTALLSASEGAALGQPAPNFTLTGVNGKTHKLADFKGKIVVLEWINHGCPFVKKHYGAGNIQALQREYTAKGVVWLSVCSSAKGKEGNMTPAEWKKTNAEKGSAATAVLLDEPGKVGKLYGAKTTPHMYIVDAQGTLVYRGAIDDTASAGPADIPTSKNYVRAALDEALAGKAVTTPDTKPYGCSVKYK